MASCRFLTERTTPLPTTLEEIQQSTRVDNDGVGGVGGGRRRRSGHRSRDKHGRDGEADVGAGDGVIGLRRREHPRGNDKSGRSGRFDGSRRWERRVIGGGEGMQGSEEGGGSRTRRGGKRLPWTRIVVGGSATPPTGRRSGRLRRRWSGRERRTTLTPSRQWRLQRRKEGGRGGIADCRHCRRRTRRRMKAND